jgi:aspartyl-tRNA(Asn)/glutamyl-tRNA(Gln) amidotransferase subunit A
VAEAHLAQIEKGNSKLNAFVQVDAEGALRQARQAENALARGEAGPLPGVPLSIRNSIAVAGLRCEAGSELRAGYVARHDAPPYDQRA